MALASAVGGWTLLLLLNLACDTRNRRADRQKAALPPSNAGGGSARDDNEASESGS